MDELPKKIEILEAELGDIQQRLSDPALYQKEPTKVTELNARMTEVEAELAQLYQRWEALEALQSPA